MTKAAAPLVDVTQIGTYRDRVLTIEKLARNIPMIREVAIPDIMLRAAHYRQEGPDLVNIFTGKRMEEEISEAPLRKESPHYFADYAPVTEEQLTAELIERAMIGSQIGGPSLKARGELLKQVGAKQYAELLQQYGCNPNNLKPGISPKQQEEDAAANQKRTARKSNPWSAEGWSLARQGDLVKTLGQEKAAAIAASAGCKIGSTRPNPKCN